MFLALPKPSLLFEGARPGTQPLDVASCLHVGVEKVLENNKQKISNLEEADGL